MRIETNIGLAGIMWRVVYWLKTLLESVVSMTSSFVTWRTILSLTLPLWFIYFILAYIDNTLLRKFELDHRGFSDKFENVLDDLQRVTPNSLSRVGIIILINRLC